jgi:hypothetical protein
LGTWDECLTAPLTVVLVLEEEDGTPFASPALAVPALATPALAGPLGSCEVSLLPSLPAAEAIRVSIAVERIRTASPSITLVFRFMDKRRLQLHRLQMRYVRGTPKIKPLN